MASDSRHRHRSFLVRLWRAGNGNAPEWRLSLEDTQSHERHGFADLPSLIAFLEGQLRTIVQQPPASETHRDEANNSSV